MSQSDIYDLAVVGAGIVGAATAQAFQTRFAGARVVLLEKEAGPAVHQTSHNSGVVHTGVYYRPDSLKAKLCVEGHRRMLEFCEEHRIPHRVTGKLIVAVNESELGRLKALRERSAQNGVKAVTWITQGGLKELEPHAGGIAALHIPDTAITSYELVTRQMIQNILRADGDVQFNFELNDINIEAKSAALRSTRNQYIRARMVVVCTGVQADRTQRLVLDDRDFSILPFRGAYYELKPEAARRLNALIYPVPDPRFPFLGVHITKHIDDSASCGPNAVLSLARSSYYRHAVTPKDLVEVLRFPGTWMLARKYWREGTHELIRDVSKRRFARAAQRYMPELTASDLENYHFGIRAQALTRLGNLIDDFDFVRSKNVLFVRNAPSPAATASLAIADHILNVLLR